MKRLVILTIVLIACCSTGFADEKQWRAPIGIPAPQFGIENTHRAYADLPGYRDSGNGPYTTYVDNTAPNCRNNGPATASEPRCDIPTDLREPGEVIEIHGGPYDYHGAKLTIDANGSAEQPVYLRGINDGNGKPSIFNATNATFQGQYFIIEGLLFDQTQVRNKGASASKYGHRFISMRHLEITRHPRKNGSVLAGSNIVFYDNHVHHNQGDDRHGTSVRPGADRIWIVDNYYHHNGGDAIQFCHGCQHNPPNNIYIGRNLMHSDRENAVDLKYGKNIIISQNTMYGYIVARPKTTWCFDDESYCGVYSSGSDGSAIVVGSDGAPGNPWILYNNISNSEHGIRVEEVYGAWIIGNDIHDIRGSAFVLQKNGAPLHIVSNTIHEASIGINQYWRDNFELHIHNNIFSNINGLYLNVGVDVARASTIQNNLFWRDGNSIPLRWGRTARRAFSSSGLNLFTDGSGNIQGDPDFVDVTSGNFHLRPTSVAINAGNTSMEQHKIHFKALFGYELSISGRINECRADCSEIDGRRITFNIGSH